MPSPTSRRCPAGGDVHWRQTYTYTPVKTKLTLRLNEDVIERAKAYAAARGTSLSVLAENYFRLVAPDDPTSGGNGRTTEANSDWRSALPPAARELVGSARGPKTEALRADGAAEEAYRRHLEAKHR